MDTPSVPDFSSAFRFSRSDRWVRWQKLLCAPSPSHRFVSIMAQQFCRVHSTHITYITALFCVCPKLCRRWNFFDAARFFSYVCVCVVLTSGWTLSTSACAYAPRPPAPSKYVHVFRKILENQSARLAANVLNLVEQCIYLCEHKKKNDDWRTRAIPARY